MSARPGDAAIVELVVRPALAPLIRQALRDIADAFEAVEARNSSPDADQGMPTPGAGVHVHAPGVRPN